MRISFVPQAWDDYQHWLRTDKKILKRVNGLIADISRHPFEGIGKPEPLRHEFAGYWSRRIDQVHRLVYRVEAEELLIIQCRFHYGAGR